MSISVKRKLVAGAAGLAVLAGAGGAYAAGQSGPATAAKPADHAAEQKAFLDDVAKRLNVTRDQLDAAIKGAAEARIDAAVAAGKLTKEQGEAAKKRLAAAGCRARPRPRLGGRRARAGARRARLRRPRLRLGLGFGARGRGEVPRDDHDAAAQAARDGKSLADIAKAKNKTVDGLKAAIKAAVTKRLDQAVKDGKLTQTQRTRSRRAGRAPRRHRQPHAAATVRRVRNSTGARQNSRPRGPL